MTIGSLRETPAILADFALIGAARFSLYTCLLARHGERYRGGTLMAGSAALGYAAGGMGLGATGSIMDLFVPSAGVGLALVAFTAAFASARQP